MIFLCRAFDNLRMGVISQTNINVVGSHAGVSIGEDGPSQMALEDLAMFQSLPGTVFLVAQILYSLKRWEDMERKRSSEFRRIFTVALIG